MNYPFWDIDVGYGMLMAIVAVVHVFISHFAIGGGLYLVLAEMAARKKADAMRLEFLRRLTKFFVMVSVVAGALTGVGIWFVIGLLNPAATEVLIRNFVWGWAIEWTFFVIEIAAAIIYFYGWEKMSARSHIIVGWIYFIAAWLSLVVINGIICFMLTPGEWIVTGGFWDGFFNPTYWPSLFLRTGICIMLAGIYAMVVASRYPADKFKVSLVRYNAWYGLIGLGIIGASFHWWWSAIPTATTDAAIAVLGPMMTHTELSSTLALALAIVLIIFGLIIPKRMHMVVALVLMALGLAWFGRFEYLREWMRKPYVVTEYMYGNAVEVSKADQYLDEGMLPSIKYRSGNDGRDLFNRACRSCHTIDGYAAIKPVLDGTDVEFITGLIKGTHVMVGEVMPQFFGTEEEAAILARYIDGQIDHRPLSEIYDLQGLELGRKAYDIRCGKCHEFGGYNDKAETLVGLEEEDYHDILDNASDYADEMPPYTGDAVEREALIMYLMSLEEGGVQ
jgi:mono/diheme cytochrome c family protein